MENEKAQIAKKIDKGINLFENNKYDESIKIFNELIKDSRTKIIGIFFLGVIEVKRKNPEIAKKFFFEVLKINKNHEDANLNLGLVYLEERNYATSLNYFKKVLLCSYVKKNRTPYIENSTCYSTNEVDSIAEYQQI